MRCENHVIELAELLRNKRIRTFRRFIPEYVEPGPGNAFFLQSPDELRLVDDAAPRGIDEKRLALHQAELTFSDELMRARIIIAGNADEVAALEQIIQIGGPLDAKFLFPLGG